MNKPLPRHPLTFVIITFLWVRNEQEVISAAETRSVQGAPHPHPNPHPKPPPKTPTLTLRATLNKTFCHRELHPCSPPAAAHRDTGAKCAPMLKGTLAVNAGDIILMCIHSIFTSFYLCPVFYHRDTCPIPPSGMKHLFPVLIPHNQYGDKYFITFGTISCFI